jgi:uncharacterized Tic20 family protein
MVQPNPYELPPSPPKANELDYIPSNEDRNLAIIAHLSGCAGVLGGGLLGFVGPLVIYLLKKDSSPYLEVQSKEALNFQITIFLGALLAAVLTAVTCGMLFPLLFAPMILQVVFAVIAAMAVRDGKNYRYPYNFRLLQ